MKLNKYIPLTLILFLSSILPAYAECTQDEINAFKKVEDEYVVTYDFNKDTKDYSLTFSISQTGGFAYVFDPKINTDNFQTATDTSFTYTGIQPGEYKIEIVSANKDCNETLKEINLKLDKYNPYSEDELCNGIEEFVLCQPTYGKDIDYDTFVSRTKTYINTKKKSPIEEPNIETPQNKIIKYLQENWIEIVGGISITSIILVMIIVTAKKARKSRRLE